MRIEKTFITPAMAEEWLGKRWERQRPLREGHVQRLVADLLANKFHFGPQAVAFDVRGRLVDGQHRLEASRRSGVGFQSLVAHDVSELAVPKLGQSEGWSLAALLNLHSETRQFGAQHNVQTAASIASFLFKQLSTKRRRPSDDEAIAVLLHFRDSILWSLDACSGKPLSKIPVRSALVLMHASSRQASTELFAEKIRTGAGLSRNDAALTLRDYLLAEKSVLKRDAPDWQFYKTLRAGEAYVGNEKLHKLFHPKDPTGAIREQMDFFLGNSLLLADKLGLLKTGIQAADQAEAHVDGTSTDFEVRDADKDDRKR